MLSGSRPDGDVMGFVTSRARGRYALTAGSSAATAAEAAWKLLVGSVYSQDVSVQDTTGVKTLNKPYMWSFLGDRSTPSTKMCMLWDAWGKLIEVADDAVAGEKAEAAAKAAAAEAKVEAEVAAAEAAAKAKAKAKAKAAKAAKATLML